MGLSTSSILDATVEMIAKIHTNWPSEHLDIGSGHGDLIALMKGRFQVHSQACDYTDKLMELPDVTVRVADLNKEPIPFENDRFDLITFTEVVEHLEHYRETLREIFRVLKPGGSLVLTTPNILNMKSRMRFLFFGFYNLFGPLHMRESNLHSTGGHINPVSFFYLSHSLLDAGFEDITVSIDKIQSTSRFWWFLLGLPIKFISKLAIKKEKTKYGTVDQHNEQYVEMMNSPNLLLGRTIIIGCKKPA